MPSREVKTATAFRSWLYSATTIPGPGSRLRLRPRNCPRKGVWPESGPSLPIVESPRCTRSRAAAPVAVFMGARLKGIPGGCRFRLHLSRGRDRPRLKENKRRDCRLRPNRVPRSRERGISESSSGTPFGPRAREGGVSASDLGRDLARVSVGRAPCREQEGRWQTEKPWRRWLW